MARGYRICFLIGFLPALLLLRHRLLRRKELAEGEGSEWEYGDECEAWAVVGEDEVITSF